MTTTKKKIAPIKALKAAAPQALAPKIATTPTVPMTAAKVEPKVGSKPVAKKTPLRAKVAAKPASKTNGEKTSKPKKPKLVRDSFTIPKGEYTVLEDLKQRAGQLARSVKKSELIRAGVKALAAMSDAAFLAALKAVPAIKTGRPAIDKAN
jgi:hypothetical protein